MNIIDAKGRPTRYGLACGYVERYTLAVDDDGNETVRELWREHGCYHVREHRHGYGRVFWTSTTNLTAARKLVRIRKPFYGPIQDRGRWVNG